jgi:hypothetical protein
MKIVYFLSSLLFAQIVDKNTNEPLTGVEVVVNDKSYYTDLDGKVKIDNVEEGDTLHLNFVSYDDTTVIYGQEKTFVLNQ